MNMKLNFSARAQRKKQTANNQTETYINFIISIKKWTAPTKNSIRFIFFFQISIKEQDRKKQQQMHTQKHIHNVYLSNKM